MLGAHMRQQLRRGDATIEQHLGNPLVAASLDAVITSAELSPISGMELCWEARLIAGGRRPLYIILMTSKADGSAGIAIVMNGSDSWRKYNGLKYTLPARAPL